MTTRYDEWARQRDQDRGYGDSYREHYNFYRDDYGPIPPPSPSTNDMAVEHIRYLETKIEELRRHISELEHQHSRILRENDEVAAIAKEFAKERDRLKEQIQKLNEYDKFDIMDVE